MKKMIVCLTALLLALVMAVCCLIAVLSCKETKDVDFTK